MTTTSTTPNPGTSTTPVPGSLGSTPPTPSDRSNIASDLPTANRPSAETLKARKENTDRLVQGLLQRIQKGESFPSLEVATLSIVEEQMFRITHAELQAIVDANTDHPIAKEYAAALLKTPSDEHPLTVERVHIEAILTGKAVAVDTTYENVQGKQTRVDRKRLVDLPVTTSTGPGKSIPNSSDTALPGESRERSFDVVGNRR